MTHRLLGLITLIGCQITPISLTWEAAGADATIPRFEAQGLTLDGKLYVFGGFYNDRIQATLQSDVYDPATNTWTRLTPLPEKLTHAGQATDGRLIYLAGGFVGNHPGGSSHKLWVYDVAANSWSEGPRMPAKRGGGALVHLGGALHYFGGTFRPKGGDYVQDYGDHWVLQLDDQDAGWTMAASLPNPRNHIGGCVADGKIYAVGGQHLGDEESGNQGSVQVYDPATDEWTNAADLPFGRGHLTANTLERNGRIIVVSGVMNGRKAVATIEVYDPATDKWSTLTPLPEPRQSGVSGIVGDKLIVTGGSLSVTTWIGKFSL